MKYLLVSILLIGCARPPHVVSPVEMASIASEPVTTSVVTPVVQSPPEEPARHTWWTLDDEIQKSVWDNCQPRDPLCSTLDGRDESH